MPNQPQQRQNMFTRYSGEQVQQIPAGYIEGMSSMGRAAQGVASFMAQGMADKAKLEVASKQGTIDARKADALDKANALKQQGLDAESAYKAYSLAADAEDKTYTRVKDATSSLGGSIGILKEEIGNKDTTEERRREAALELKQAKIDFAESTKRMVALSKQTPLTFDSFQESQRKIREQRLREAMPGAALPARPATPATVPTSYYQSPAFQSPFSTGMEDNATKTVAFGGSPKKAEVVGGRVSSVVTPDGTKHRVGGWVSEADLPAINQVVTAMEASSAGNAYGTPSGAETPGPTPAPVEEKVALNGPLNSKYFHTEPLTPINGSSNRDNRHGTIFFEETVSPSTGQKTRTPIVKYNSNQLVNADGSQNADAHMELRRLTLINEVLKSGEYKNTSPDQAERDAADDAFGTVDNALDMPAIRQAYAFVDRNLQNKSNGGIEADMWGSRFELTYGQRPSMFIAQGDAIVEEYITPSAEVALRATANGRMARALEDTSSAPKEPEGLSKSIADNDTALKFWKGEIARLDKLLGDPNTVNHKPTLDALKNKRAGAVTQLEAENKITQSIQTQVSNLDVQNRQYIARQKLAADELALDESVARLDKMGREKTDDIEKLVTRWVGIRPQDLKRTNGFVAQGLRDLPKISQQIPIMINGKPTGKYYSDRLDSGELLEALRKNGDYKTIARLTRNMPTEEQLYNKDIGIYAKQKKWDESIWPMNRLNELNNELIKEQKSTGGSWASVALMKVRMPNGDLATAGALQKTLVGAIRESVVGPGNPSNYEQEVLSSIVPDPSEILGIPSRQKARLQALATISMLHHYNSMISNGLSPTEETLKMYSKQIGQVLGYEVTPATFKGLYDDWDRQKTMYRNSELVKSPNSNIPTEYAKRLIDSLEARTEASK